jgi:hypothetical protein
MTIYYVRRGVYYRSHVWGRYSDQILQLSEVVAASGEPGKWDFKQSVFKQTRLFRQLQGQK